MSAYDLYSFFTYENIYLWISFFTFILGLEGIFVKKEKQAFWPFFTQWIKGKFAKGLFATVITIICIFYAFGINPQTYILFGSEDIRIMPEGTYCRYVYATNENGKTYTLPARVDVHETNIENAGVMVYNVYFENGGYLYFRDSCNPTYNKITGKITDDGFDQNDRDWDIEVTLRKAYHNKVEETNPNNISKLILPFVMSIAVLISLIKFITLKQKEENYV